MITNFVFMVISFSTSRPNEFCSEILSVSNQFMFLFQITLNYKNELKTVIIVKRDYLPRLKYYYLLQDHVMPPIKNSVDIPESKPLYNRDVHTYRQI